MKNVLIGGVVVSRSRLVEVGGGRALLLVVVIAAVAQPPPLPYQHCQTQHSHKSMPILSPRQGQIGP